MYTSPWTGFKLTNLVVIGSDCTGKCQSNYHDGPDAVIAFLQKMCELSINMSTIQVVFLNKYPLHA
jgi:hypothetical protein